MPSNRIILLHGFNVRDGGERTVGRLRPYLIKAGFADVKLVSYGWFGLLGAAFFNDNMARMLARMAQPGDVLIGHSNACAMAYRALRDNHAPFAHLVFINPALKAVVPFPAGPRSIHVWHSPSDLPVRVARLFSWFTLWGAMGSIGYRGPFDSRVTNFNKQDAFTVSSRGHSDVFSDRLLPFFAPRIVGKLKEAIEQNQDHED